MYKSIKPVAKKQQSINPKSFNSSFIIFTYLFYLFDYKIELFVFNSTNIFKSCYNSVEKNYKILNAYTAQNISCLYLHFKALSRPFYVYPSNDTKKIF